MVIVANVVKAPRHHALKLPHGYTWLGVSLGSHTDLRRAAVITLPTAYRVTWSIMGKREGSGVILVSIASSVIISAVVTLLMCSTSTMAAVSSSLNSAPLVVQIIGSSSAAFIALDADCWAYELYSLFDASQGLTSNLSGTSGLFNPGADIDFTTTTDFEDLAAPVADVMEFTDQDRALAADSISSVLFWNGVVGFVFGASLRLILSSDLWRDVL